ncbi:ATP-binding protein [Nocardioides alpinus]|uniref:ATP-binding protein n=1 Tax=Nocardioides alpinus TaxID=748909 RepID=A0ABX4QX33_9ACTN|nr:ATP-binding protein [Nocardioides alpinus]
MPVGTWTSGDTGADARLRAQGFGRHTFLCGQSGSGKTYALGVLLEQVRLHTGLRIVVLDPNADYVRMNQVRPGVPDDVAAAWQERGPVTVLGSDASGAEPLRLRFATMPRAAQAAVLRLDPLRDRGEYNLFVRLMGHGRTAGVATVVAELAAGTPDERALAQRMENLGLLDWEVWAAGQTSAAEVVDAGASMTVLDLNGFKDPHESTAVCLDLVEHLWARRADRTPTLLVLDEAHNLCPAEPSGTMQAALVDRLIQIAAEGRKYGLWLLLSTQRPSKLHPQVLSQCDNLVLMRMNSRADLAELATVFGSVPHEMLDASPTFTQGEALVAGPLAPVPTLLRMGDRITVEGGSDVRVPDRS